VTDEQEQLEPPVSEVVGRLRESRKYRHLAFPALVRVSRWSLRDGRTPQEAVKVAKRKLHQVYGAYLEPGAVAAAERAAGTLEGGSLSQEQQRSLCLEVLRRHASTSERLPVLERFYADLFGDLPPVLAVMDLACGLNPFALPWIPLPAGAGYLAVDVDDRLTSVFDRLSRVWPVSLRGLSHDLASGPPHPPPDPLPDLVLLLKAIPCLEQQETGAGWRLLETLAAPCLVVSFPARSLGGREKGMQQNYDRQLRERIRDSGRAIETFSYPTETVYRLR
jgi:16S rRNA (guanine(1405)-N(7))-methyltransferase